MGAALWPTELSRHSWPPGSRTQRLPAHQAGPFTGWVAASGTGASRTPKSEARPGSSRVQSPICLRFHDGRRGRELNSQGRSSAVFETGPVTSRVASPCADGGRIERPRVVKTRPPVSSRAPCHSVNHPCEEGGRLERHGINRASLSGRARRACPVHLP